MTALATIPLALLAACSSPPGTSADADAAARPVIVPTDGPRPDIVLIVLDGVRKDSRPEEDQTATLVSAFPAPPLANFAGAYATSASPFTAFGSLLTGLYAAAVPLCRPRDGSSTLKGNRAWCTELPAARPSLPDILAVYGYDTVLLTTGGVGYDTFEARFAETVNVAVSAAGQLPGAAARADLAVAAAAWWTAHQDHPRFVLAHVTDVDDALNFSRMASSATPPPSLAPAKMTSRGPVETDEQAASTREELKKRYTAAIAALAPSLTALDAALPAAPGRDRYTALLSDSAANLGETTGFGEGHVGFDARQLLLERSLHVPLVIWGPTGAQPQQPNPNPNEVAELTDVLPTLLARVAAVLPAGASGRDLLGGTADPTPWAYADFGDMLSLREGVYRLTLRTYQHDGSSLDPALTARAKILTEANWTFHQVISDPLEANDLTKAGTPEDAAAMTRLHETLVRIRTGAGAPPPDAVTPEKLWALRMSAGQGYW